MNAIKKNPLGAFCTLMVFGGLFAFVEYACYHDKGAWGLLILPGIILAVAMFISSINFICGSLENHECR